MIIGTIAVASSILVISMRNPVHSALFLLLAFICVAVLFMMKEAEFVAAVQVLVYAGGIMVLFLFVIMLINHQHLKDEKIVSPMWLGGIGIGLGVFILLATMVRPGTYHDPVGRDHRLRSEYEHRVRRTQTPEGIVRQRYRKPAVVGNSEAVGMALYRDYLVPFEVASLFLLVAMIGAIVIGKRELSSAEEESVPQYMLDRAETEKRVKKQVKEAVSA
jgi:NADH-quinone oxidoreductase subunit J